MRLIELKQFDTIYHEHFSYLSLFTVRKIFSKIGLRIFNVKELNTHGGSLRIYGCHFNNHRKTENSVDELLKKESKQGLQKLETYFNFQSCADVIKDDFISFLIQKKEMEKKWLPMALQLRGTRF